MLYILKSGGTKNKVEVVEVRPQSSRIDRFLEKEGQSGVRHLLGLIRGYAEKVGDPISSVVFEMDVNGSPTRPAPQVLKAVSPPEYHPGGWH